MAYEHLIQNSPTEATLRYKGKEEPVYFRRLTAGESMRVKRGQKGTMKAGESSFEVDFGDLDARNHLILSFSNVTADGKQVFRNEGEVAKLPDDLVEALITARGEAIKEDQSGN